MDEMCYTVGIGRRFVAGNIWCAQTKNSGKLPCLRCRGSGTIGGTIRNRCPECKLTGHADPEIWFIWFRLWVQLKRKNYAIHSSIHAT